MKVRMPGTYCQPTPRSYGRRSWVGSTLIRMLAIVCVGVVMVGIWQDDGPAMTAVPSTTTFATTRVCGDRVCP